MKSWRSHSAKTLATALWLAAASLGGQAAPLNRVDAQIELEGVAAISAHLKRALPRYLNRELLRRQVDAPAGSRLVVRVTDIFLSSDIGGDPDGGLMMDALDGEALLLDSRGAVLSRFPLKARVVPELGPMGASREPRRVEALAESMAYWAARALE